MVKNTETEALTSSDLGSGEYSTPNRVSLSMYKYTFAHPVFIPINPLSIIIPKQPLNFPTNQFLQIPSRRDDSTPFQFPTLRRRRYLPKKFQFSAEFYNYWVCAEMQTTASYVDALEAELAKMMMFEKELPLSIQLVSQAIDSCRDRLLSLSASGNVVVDQTNACHSLSEDTASDDLDTDVARPVLEFIPIKKCTHSSSSESEEIRGSDGKEDISALGKKSDWLSSAQLWNKSPDPPSNSEHLVTLDECKSMDEKMLKEKSSAVNQTESSSAESQKSGGCNKEDKEGSSKRKQRRCWSQDLHRRFLISLKQLGGAHVATPKQIRELMKVDGLTNDEVKSHLQKYRLHTRRPAPTPSQSNVNAPPQFVVVGNIWPPNDKEVNVAFGTSGTSVYTPMAAPPLVQSHSWQGQPFDQKTQLKSKNNEGHGDALARCNSLSMSSSTRTTASQVY